jgi:hypothetical protein
MKKNKTYVAIIAFSALIFVLFVQAANAQSRMVMNNNVYMVIDNSANLVINNSNPNAITTAGAGGNIISENENDKIKWVIGIATGNYIVPFSTSTGTKIPFTQNITAGGIGLGHFLFSTYNGPTWNNTTYMPSDVTHMNNILTGTNNSANTIDRFWIVDAQSYTTKPTAAMTFTYVDAEHLAAGNTITESNLAAQRFNSTTNTWGDFAPEGTVNTATNTVSGVLVNPGDLFRSWTLSLTTNPLPVELLSYEIECASPQNKIKWTTASETNNDYFLVEQSEDGINFTEYKKLTGAGTTNSTNTYSQNLPMGEFYYRLSQTDFDGSTEILGILINTCASTDFSIWQPIQEPDLILLNGLQDGELELTVFDMSGKLIWNDKQTVEKGNRQIKIGKPATGIYLVLAKNNQTTKTLKIVL